jgi:hypothetical protein
VRRTLTISVLLLVLGGCGYSSESECLVKEMQECDSAYCEIAARDYCDDEFPAKKTWDIYEKAPKSWVNIEVESYRLTLKANQHRYEKVEVCLKKNWSLGKGRCGKISLNQYTQHRNGRSWTEEDSDRDWFYKYINTDGDGLKENTKVVVTKAVEVGFFRYYIVGTLFLILKILAGGFVITIFIMFFNGELKTKDEDEETEEENKYGMDFEEGDEVEIPEREQLESMTKDEIKAWADVFEFNVPSSLNKAEMIDRFVEETDAYVESLEK